MDLKGITLNEANQRNMDTIYFHFYVEPKKQNKQMNITKEKQTHTYREQISGCHWGGERRGKRARRGRGTNY